MKARPPSLVIQKRSVTAVTSSKAAAIISPKAMRNQIG